MLIAVRVEVRAAVLQCFGMGEPMGEHGQRRDELELGDRAGVCPYGFVQLWGSSYA